MLGDAPDVRGGTPDVGEKYASCKEDAGLIAFHKEVFHSVGMEAPPVKTAIIGMGRWGKNVAREAARESELVAYAFDANPATAAHARAHFPNAKRCSVEEIAANPEIGAVFIATPIRTHASMVEGMLRAGKHVFVEKPLAEHAAEAEALAALAASKRRMLMTGYVYLFSASYEELKRRIEGKRIAEVTLAWEKYGSFGEDIVPNLATHHAAFALDLMGEPESLSASFGAGVESACDQLEVVYAYANARVISRIDRASREQKHGLIVQLADGTRLAWNGAALLDERGTVLHEDDTPPLTREIHSFVGAIAGSNDLRNDPAFASKVVALTDAITAHR